MDGVVDKVAVCFDLLVEQVPAGLGGVWGLQGFFHALEECLEVFAAPAVAEVAGSVLVGEVGVGVDRSGVEQLQQEGIDDRGAEFFD